ncbi:MAG: sensor histidine kinase [Candidatus Heteroscillospira sp.]|jgi:two-component system OmpR family sensor kinase
MGDLIHKLGSRMRLRGLKSRWMATGIGVTVFVVLLGVWIIAGNVYSNYYRSVETGLEAKATTASEFFSTYVSRTYAEFYQSACRYTEGFEDRDRIELQFLSSNGRVETSSYGLTAGTRPATPDIENALTTGEISSWNGRRADTGEHVLAVCAPLKSSDGTVIGLIRYITSLRLVDRTVMHLTAAAAGVGLLIILFIILSNFYFISTITAPVLELTGIARRISDGSYGIQVVKKHDDEIGDLIDSINDMSVKLGRAEKMQTDFISSVSHELRTPLTAITGWSETLAYDEAIQGESRRGILIISKEASRLTKMVEDLLEFTRIEDGRFNLTLEKIDPAAELEEAIFTYGELLKQEGIELQYYPDYDGLPMIEADPERLRQVFLNILDNAAKYGRDGKKIIVRMGRCGDYIRISVHNFGPGIPEAELPYVKKKFYKGSSRERGSGIGLAVCDEIITRHKGLLDIENAPEGGVLVTIRLPIESANT